MKAKFFLVFFSILLSLGMAEGFLRIQDIYVEKRYGPMTDEDLLWTYNALLGWKHRPHETAYFCNPVERFKTLCKTNSHGLRDDEYTYSKPQGVLRILLLGDSATVGLEVEKEKVIDSVLEKLIHPQRACEVLNAGVRGYGTDQSYLFLTHEGIRYDPDIVIYVFVENDPEDNITIHRLARKYGKPYFVLENSRLLLKGVPVPRSFPEDRWLLSSKASEDFYNRAIFPETPPLHVPIWSHSLLYRKVVSMSESKRSERIPPEPARVREDEWKITETLLEAMKKFCDQKRIHFVVFRFTQGRDRPLFKETRLKKLTERRGIELIENRDIFFKEGRGTRKLVFRTDPHWNAQGHALGAKILFHFLQEKNWL